MHAIKNITVKIAEQTSATTIDIQIPSVAGVHTSGKEATLNLNRFFFEMVEKNADLFMPRGKYLIGYGKGDYGNVKDFYDKMLDCVNKNNLCPQGFFYEEYLIDELSEKNPDNFIFKVGVRIDD